MRAAWDLLRAEPAARWFFLAHSQSSLGTGAAYVALILIVYERLESPWAIALVLLGDFLPSMLFGPLFGAAVDRWSRRTCAIVGDAVRAIAFLGLALIDSFAATLAFALLAGAGTALFLPAVMAGIPSLVSPPRVPAATSLFGALTDLGFTAGPGLAAVAFLVVDPETLMLVNAGSFAVSALLLARLRYGQVSWDKRAEPRSLVGEAVRGSREVLALPGVRTVIVASSAVILFAGLFNVAELLLAREELGASDTVFSLLVATFGVGVLVGSLAGGRGGTLAALKRRYLAGIVVFGVGLLAAGLAPTVAVALVAFAVGGVGNGLVLVHERLILQTTVADALLGRVFALKDAGTSWGFGIAFVSAGALLSSLGTREVIVAAGALILVVWVVAAVALRRAWTQDDDATVAEPLPVEDRGRAGAPAGPGA